MNRAIRGRRNDIFFGQRLQRIGQRLHDAEKPHPVRTVAVLNPTQSLPLQDRREGKQGRKDEQDGKDGQQDREGRLNRCRRVA